MADELNAPPGFSSSGVAIGDTVDAPPGIGAAPADMDAPPGMTSAGTQIGQEVDAPPMGNTVQTKAPRPMSTPHTYDNAILDAAKKHGLDPKILRMVGMQETGLGSSGVYDPKLGVSRTAGNAGHGIFQLDPASGASKETLERAAKDPAFAADYAAGMLKNSLNANHGDLRAALAAYNAGDPSSKVGQAYAEHVLSAFGNLDELQPHQQPDLVAKVSHVMRVAQHAQQRGKDPWKAVAKTPEFKPMAKFEHAAAKRWEWLQKNPVEGFFDVLSAGQRAVGAAVDTTQYNAENKQNVGKKGFVPDAKRADMLRSMWDAVINPSENNQFRTTESIRKVVHAPTHADIDKFVKANLWDNGMLKTGIKATEDMMLQGVSDPLTYVGGFGLAERAVKAAGGVLKASYHLMEPEARKWFPHLMTAADTGHELISRATGVRRDLDAAGFTRNGKRARIALENSELTARTEAKKVVRNTASDPVAAATHYAETLAEHGTPQSAADAHRYLGKPVPANHNPTAYADKVDHVNDMHELANPETSPERRIEINDNLADELFNKRLNERSMGLFAGKDELFKGAPADLYKIDVNGNENIDKILSSMSQVTGPLASLGRKAIMWNPLPHGFKNVGTLAYLAGGLPAVMRGIGGMIKPVDHAVVKELHEMGAMPSYLDEHLKNPVEGFLNNRLEHMEVAWRAGLKETLDKKLGVPQTETDKLMRGWMINDKIGDYRNSSAMVKIFKALGGPFVAFRAGIVPRNVIASLIENPARLENIARAQTDVNENREGKNKNELVFGGPTEDFVKMLADPKKYAADTIGGIASLGEQANAGEGALHMLTNMLHVYLPWWGAGELAQKELAGAERPGQHVNLSDQIEDLMLQLYGSYYKHTETRKQEHLRERKIDKGGF